MRQKSSLTPNAERETVSIIIIKIIDIHTNTNIIIIVKYIGQRRWRRKRYAVLQL